MVQFIQPKQELYANGTVSRQMLDFEGGSLRLISSQAHMKSCEAILLPRYLLYHIFEGQKTFYCGKETWQVSAGSAFLIRRQAALSCEARMDDGEHYRALSLHLDLDLIDVFLQHYPVENQALEPFSNACLIEPSPLFTQMIQGLDACFSGEVWSEFLHHKAQEVLLYLLHGKLAPDCQAVCAEALSPRRRAYLSMLEDAIETPLSTEGMASKMLMSLSAFKREFQSLFSQTPARYLLLRRLERAQQMLLTTSHTLKQIANIIGFENDSHFVQTFKREFGLTPGAYREEWRIS